MNLAKLKPTHTDKDWFIYPLIVWVYWGFYEPARFNFQLHSSSPARYFIYKQFGIFSTRVSRELLGWIMATGCCLLQWESFIRLLRPTTFRGIMANWWINLVHIMTLTKQKNTTVSFNFKERKILYSIL